MYNSHGLQTLCQHTALKKSYATTRLYIYIYIDIDIYTHPALRHVKAHPLSARPCQPRRLQAAHSGTCAGGAGEGATRQRQRGLCCSLRACQGWGCACAPTCNVLHSTMDSGITQVLVHHLPPVLDYQVTGNLPEYIQDSSEARNFCCCCARPQVVAVPPVLRSLPCAPTRIS